MHSENPVVHESCKRKVVKDVCAIPPYVNTSILSKTFVIKTVNLGDLPRLVITTDKGDAIRVADLVAQ